MTDIRFIAQFGEHEKQVELLNPFGAAGIYQLLIDKFYQGLFVKHQNKWEFRPQKDNHEFTTEDVQAIIERIEAC